MPSFVIACLVHAGLIALVAHAGTRTSVPETVSLPIVVATVPVEQLAAVPPAAQPVAEAAQVPVPQPVARAADAPSAAPPGVDGARPVETRMADRAPPEPDLAVPPSLAALPAQMQAALAPASVAHSPGHSLPREPARHASPVRAQSRPDPADAPADPPPSRPVASAAKPAAAPAPAVSAGAEASFEGRLLAAVQAEARRNYPAAARMMGVVGQAAVAFDYHDGSVRVTGLAQSSGSPVLDRAALAAVQAASYPPPPPALAGHTLSRIVHVRFDLSGE